LRRERGGDEGEEGERRERRRLYLTYGGPACPIFLECTET